MLWHLSSSTQSYCILITSLDTDCPSTGWPVGEKAKILPKHLLVERIWHCHGMTRLRASHKIMIFVQYWAIRLCFICMPCFVCIICWNGPPWFLPLGIVDPKNLKNMILEKPQTSSCWLQGTLGSFEHPVCICSSCKYSWNTRETWFMLEALNDVKWENLI